MKIEMINTDKIIPYSRNPRFNQQAIDKVASSIKEYGWKQPIVLDKDNVIIVGHTRLLAAQKLGIDEVPVHIAEDLTPQQVKAYRIADNRTAEFAEWDMDMLSVELEEVGELFTGYDEMETEEILGRNNGNDEDPNDTPDVPNVEDAVSVLGDVWLLGKHKVICGSSTELETYEQLMGDEIADMVWTDPPYNVAYESPAQRHRRENGKSVRGYGGDISVASVDHAKIDNDDMSSEAFRAFLNDAFSCAAQFTKKGGCAYCAYSEKEGTTFREAFGNNYMYKQTLVWVKNRCVFGRQDYNHSYEPIMYGWKEGAAHYWSGDYCQTTVIDARENLNNMKKEELLELLVMIAATSDVIDVDKPSKSDLHPTMKPVELVEKQITSSSKYGEIVLDPFGGSGSTLIAAEKSGRKARLIELKPQYVDVICKRYEQYSHDTATHVCGKSFNEMETERGKTN